MTTLKITLINQSFTISHLAACFERVGVEKEKKKNSHMKGEHNSTQGSGSQIVNMLQPTRAQMNLTQGITVWNVQDNTSSKHVH